MDPFSSEYVYLSTVILKKSIAESNINTMKNLFIQLIIKSGRDAQKALNHMSPQERRRIETVLDIEHAYYSSALEGCKLDRGDFEKLAEVI